MKKIYLLFVVTLFAASTAFGQMFVGGTFDLTTSKAKAEGGGVSFASETDMEFSLVPEVGFKLSDNFAVGIEVGMTYSKTYSSGTYSPTANVPYSKGTFLHFSPYARMDFPVNDKLYLFAKAGFGIISGTPKYVNQNQTSEGATLTTFTLGVEPGLAYRLSDNFVLQVFYGNLGYYSQSSKETDQSGATYKTSHSNIDFDLTFSNLNFGLHYYFGSSGMSKSDSKKSNDYGEEEL